MGQCTAPAQSGFAPHAAQTERSHCSSHCGHKEFLSSSSVLASLSGTNSVYLQIFLSSEQAQQAQEQLSWTHPAQKIRQSSGRAAAWLPLAQPSSGHHTGHHAKERRSKPIPNSFWREWMDKTASETNALRQTFRVSLTAFLGQLRWSLRGLFQPHCGNGNGALRCWDSRTFRLMGQVPSVLSSSLIP